MAFFDKLGETISSKSKDVAKKAKDFADVSKLNSQINSQEEVINAAYLQIGRDCYEQHKGDAGSPYAEQFRVINDALAQIEQLRREIQVIKGVRRCPACGAEMSNEAVFCPSCGAKSAPVSVSGEAAPAQKQCPGCGTVLAADAAFCPNCGTKV
jgi:rRNA maturation endonuclease Nob1